MKSRGGRKDWATRVPTWAYAVLGVAQIALAVPQFREGEVKDLLHGGALALLGTITIIGCVLVYRTDRKIERLARESGMVLEHGRAAPLDRSAD
jgi:hypothetical protein